MYVSLNDTLFSFAWFWILYKWNNYAYVFFYLFDLSNLIIWGLLQHLIDLFLPLYIILLSE